MEYAAGVDFGGSSAKIGLTRRIKALIASRPSRDRLAVAGIGMPGFIDSKAGTVVGGSENIPCFQGKSPQLLLENALGVPVFSENDATSAAAGELAFGAGKNFADFLLITLGTAIGSGLSHRFQGILGAAAQALERLEGVRGREGPVG